MADPSGVTPPYLDPSQYPNYLDLQRKQMVAQMLMGAFQNSANSPNPQSASVGPYAVQAKRGLLQNLAPILTGALAKKGMKDSQSAEQQYFSGLYGGGPQQPAQTAPYDAGAAATAGQTAPGIAATPESQQPSGTVPAQGGSNPMIPGNMTRGTAQQLISMLGPQKYAEMISQQYTPTDLQKQLRAAGVDPSSALGRQMQQTMLAKSLYQAPIDVRPGGTLLDPNTRAPFFTGPQNGTQVGWGPNGPVAGAIPGAPEAAGTMAGAETAAKVANTPQVFPTGGGGSRVGYPGDVLGPPPAQRGNMPGTTQASGAPVTGGGRPQTPVASAPASSSTKPPQTVQAPSDPWQSVPKLKISNAVGAPDAFTEGTLKASGEKHAELSSKYGQESDLADQKLAYNAEARKALPSAEVGPMSEWMTENRSKLIQLGVPEKLIPGSGSVTPTLELNKYLTNAALQGAKATFGPRMTQSEVMLQKNEMTPSVTMTRDAISSLMKQDDIKNQYTKQRSDDYGKYIQQGGDPLRFESWYSKNFPLTKYAQAREGGAPAAAAGAASAPATPAAAPATPAAAPAAPTVGAVVKGYRFKGGNPASQSSWEKASRGASGSF